MTFVWITASKYWILSLNVFCVSSYDFFYVSFFMFPSMFPVLLTFYHFYFKLNVRYLIKSYVMSTMIHLMILNFIIFIRLFCLYSYADNKIFIQNLSFAFMMNLQFGLSIYFYFVESCFLNSSFLIHVIWFNL